MYAALNHCNNLHKLFCSDDIYSIAGNNLVFKVCAAEVVVKVSDIRVAQTW